MNKEKGGGMVTKYKRLETGRKVDRNKIKQVRTKYKK